MEPRVLEVCRRQRCAALIRPHPELDSEDEALLRRTTAISQQKKHRGEKLGVCLAACIGVVAWYGSNGFFPHPAFFVFWAICSYVIVSTPSLDDNYDGPYEGSSVTSTFFRESNARFGSGVARILYSSLPPSLRASVAVLILASFSILIPQDIDQRKRALEQVSERCVSATFSFGDETSGHNWLACQERRKRDIRWLSANSLPSFGNSVRVTE